MDKERFDNMKLQTQHYLAEAGLTAGQYERLMDLGYEQAPASKSHHLNFVGGLVHHSLNVTDNILRLSRELGYRWPREESPYLVGMLHDLVKCRCYVFKDGGIEYRDPVYPGHGEASLMIAQNEIGINFLPEEAMAIRFHMGLWGADEREKKDFNAALARCPREIIITHTADWWAARVQEEGVFEK
jgi:hypothetical protein